MKSTLFFAGGKQLKVFDFESINISTHVKMVNIKEKQQFSVKYIARFSIIS